MHTSQEKAYVRYAMLTIMVIVLLTFFMIISVRRQESQQLGLVVQNLGNNSQEAEHIDKSIQLLYSADNSFRLYTITYDQTYLNDYTQKLQRVARHIDSAMEQSNKHTVNRLLSNKQKAATLFLESKRYVDSLLSMSENWDTTAPIPPPLRQLGSIAPKISTPVKADTLVTAITKQSKSKKALLGRIRDAISNKPKEDTNKQVQIITYQDPGSNKTFTAAQLKDIQRAYNKFLKDAVTSHQQLREKEYLLVTSNEKLFSNLLSFLSDLQQEIRVAAAERRTQLTAEAQTSLYQLNKHNYWEIPLILLLAGIIIFGIVRLYRYDMALLKAKRQAEQLARQKSDFAATISHEIRTPVQSLIGFARLLAPDQPYIKAIQHSAEMLLQVVNNVLDYSRIEANEPILKKEKFSPRTAIEEVTNTLSIQAAEKGLNFEVNIYFPSSKLVVGDSFRLKQVVTNLLANAIKYTDKGEVKLTAYLRDDSLLQVSIKDTGPGISHKELPLMFNAYTQGKDHYQKGSGLGLNITQKIIELHKGKIHADSFPGKGTTFSFEITYLPANQVPATKKIIIPVSKTPSTTVIPSHVRLLVVEDSILNQKLLNLMLTKLQASFKIVSSAEEAFAVYQAEEFDFVLTDIDLPGIDGLTLAQLIRKLPDPGKAGVTIIAITGNVLEEDIELYLRSGLNDYITKPYREEEILEKINKHSQTA